MPQEISDADLDAAIGATPLTEGDIQARSQALHDAQDVWEKAQYLAVQKMPCRECGGTGQVSAGSFSDLCLGCEGTRLEVAPDAEPFDMPPFAVMRAAIGAYGDALALRGSRLERALPAPSTVPDLEAIIALKEQGLAQVQQLRQLAAAPQGRGVDPRQLPEAKRKTGFEGDGGLGDVEDAEIDRMVDDAEAKNRG